MNLRSFRFNLFWCIAGAVATAVPVTPTLTIYSYDSFSGKGGLGQKVRTLFESGGSVKLEIISFGSAGEALNQVALEGEKTRADLVVGVDGTQLQTIETSAHFSEIPADWISAGAFSIPRVKKWIPFDYGYPAFVYDDRLYQPEKGLTLDQLSKKASLVKKIALLDPRSSSLGRTFLAWTHLVAGAAGFVPFWRALSRLVLTYSPGWSGAYSLFTRKEVLMTLSYTTSPAYHIAHEKNDHVKALIFPDGHVRQEEGVAMTRYCRNKESAKRFLVTLLGREVQSAIPLTNFMYPVRKGTPLPEAFMRLPPEPKRLIAPVPQDMSSWIKDWKSAVL